MADTEPRVISITLPLEELKAIQLILNTTIKNNKKPHEIESANRFISFFEEQNNEAIKNGRNDLEVRQTYASWKKLQAFLQPQDSLLKADPLTNQKAKLNKSIQRAIDLARDAIIVTTGELRKEYEIIGPVFFQVSNKGILGGRIGSDLDELRDKYMNEIKEIEENELVKATGTDWGYLFGEVTVGQNKFEQAFYVAVQELKRRAQILGADAIICMRQDIDLDTSGFQFFYLQIYGTAVRIIATP